MLGWMILFALMILPGAAAAMTGHANATSLKTTSLIFGALFVTSVLARMVRGRAR
jgi:ABC-type Mn2+/Zn2+ transport system permease subunit